MPSHFMSSDRCPSLTALTIKRLRCWRLPSTLTRLLLGTSMCLWLAHITPANADHLPAVDPVLIGSDHEHEDHSSHDHSGENWSSTGFSGADLSNANLSNVNFFDAGSSTANLTGANLTNADLRFSFFNSANFTNANFTNADLTNADLRSSTGIADTQLRAAASVQNIGLDSVNLSGFDLSNLNLTGADLQDTNLSNVDFTNVNLTEVDFTSANLTNANFTNADLTQAQFINPVGLTDTQLQAAASVQRVVFSETTALAGFNLSNLNFSDAGFFNVSVANINFTNADLTNADFNKVVGITDTQFQAAASVQGIRFRDVVLTGFDFSNLNLINTILINVDFTDGDLMNAEVSDADLIEVDFTNANLTSANFTQTDFFDSDLSGADLTNADLTNAFFRAGTTVTDTQLQAAASVEGIFFQDADLTGFDLSSLNLSNARLNNSNLTNADLTNTNLSGTRDITDTQLQAASSVQGIILEDAQLDGSDFSNLDLTNASLVNVEFSHDNFANSNLTNADLSHTKFRDVNFTNTEFANANLAMARFTYEADSPAGHITDVQLRAAASVQGIRFSNIVLAGFDLSNLNLSNAEFHRVDLTNTNFANANLSSADLSNVELSNSILDGVNLINANFTNADLSNADLSSATGISDTQLQSAASIQGINLSGKDLSGFDLSGLSLRFAELISVDFTNTDLSNTDFTNANLTNAMVATRTLRFADFTGTNLAGATLGDATRLDGFIYDGNLNFDSATTTLQSQGFAALGTLTTLANGAKIVASRGVALGVGDNLSGSGEVQGKIAASFGSTIVASQGDLILGDADSVVGYTSDGELYTGVHTVTIHDANTSVLGSLTQLGDGVDAGALIAGNADPADTVPHLLVEEGKNLVGRGLVSGHVKNNGVAIGDGTALSERLVFDSPWTVSGKGRFTNTLILGTFSPGESPAITEGTSQAFGGRVNIELGGTSPGFGNDNHDQINDDATISLFNDPTLSILAFNSFVPNIGDTFEVMTWQSGLDGSFGDVEVDPFFTDHGIDFDLIFTNTAGLGNLKLVAIAFVPEPSSAIVLSFVALTLLGRRRISFV